MNTSGQLETGVFFLDASGRAVILRGVNLSAGKTPKSTPSHLDPFEEAEAGRVSFIGTTLDLNNGSADVHLARLRGYGFNVLRYVVCWEALEHAGPCVPWATQDFNILMFGISGGNTTTDTSNILLKF